MIPALVWAAAKVAWEIYVLTHPDEIEEAKEAICEYISAKTGLPIESVRALGELVMNGTSMVRIGRQGVRYVDRKVAHYAAKEGVKALPRPVETGSASSASTPNPKKGISELNINSEPVKVPGRVQSRINIITGKGKANTRSADNKLKLGIESVWKKHMNPERTNKSQFTISKEEVITILQDKKTVQTPISQVVPSGNYVREVDTGNNIGMLRRKEGNQPTSIVTILTDREGNLVSAYPGPFSY